MNNRLWLILFAVSLSAGVIWLVFSRKSDGPTTPVVPPAAVVPAVPDETVPGMGAANPQGNSGPLGEGISPRTDGPQPSPSAPTFQSPPVNPSYNGDQAPFAQPQFQPPPPDPNQVYPNQPPSEVPPDMPSYVPPPEPPPFDEMEGPPPMPPPPPPYDDFNGELPPPDGEVKW